MNCELSEGCSPGWIVVGDFFVGEGFTMALAGWSRREWLAGMSGWVAGGGVVGRSGLWGQDPPRVIKPRATDGDERYEPEWEDRFTVTVGNRSGDMMGSSDRVIQAALDYVARMGGGTVQLLEGSFLSRAAIWIPTGVRLVGKGEGTVIAKKASESVPLAEDSDWYDQEITLSRAGDFRVGDSVVLRAKNPHDGGATVIKRRLVARDGLRFKLDEGLRENLWLSGAPTCASLFPLLTSERCSGFAIENLTLDGDLKNNENFNGNYGGGIFLQDCHSVSIRGVESRNYHGDGISFQICHDVVVEDCYCHDNHDLGVHPGSGSQRPILRRNRLDRNSQGIFWCWGVKFGLAEENRLEGNRLYGMSIGHNDTDNVMRKNVIRDSGQVGILFRDEGGGVDFWAHRNVLEGNRIENSGGDQGIAIDIQGRTRDVVLQGNELLETRGVGERVGIRIGREVGAMQMEGNSIRGFREEVRDQRVG